MKNLLLLPIFIFLGACAKNNGNTDVATVPAPSLNVNNVPANVNTPGAQPAQYPYAYNYNSVNCTTGPQRYPTLNHYCEGLRNERLNNYCAVEVRYNDFRQYCLGRRWQR